MDDGFAARENREVFQRGTSGTGSAGVETGSGTDALSFCNFFFGRAKKKFFKRKEKVFQANKT